MVYQVNYEEAKLRLLELIEAAIRGETVFIARDNQKVVQIIPVEKPEGRRKFGIAKGQIKMADDFDEPIEDFHDYTE